MSERAHGARRSVTAVVRVMAGLVSAILVVAAGFGWAGDVRGTSNAIAAAGNVGVVGVGGPTSGPVASSQAAGSQPSSAGGAVASSAAAPPPPALGAENILLVGADSRTDAQGNPLTAAQQKEIGVPLDGGGVNTDTLLIIHIPAGGGAATGVSIPRDTWMGPSVVDAPGVTGPDQQGHQVRYLPAKINSFYGTAKYYDEQYLRSKGITGAQMERESDEAGRVMLIKVIQQFTGIKIDHIAEVNLLGFYLMSEAIGGVPVCLVHATHDVKSGADFHAGYQTVEGRTALAFVRQRYGVPGSDLGRIRREQAFLDGALDKILSAGTLTSPGRLAALVSAAKRSVVLDTGFDLLTFAEQMRGLAAGKVHFATIPTTVATGVTTTDALSADPVQVRAIFADLAAGRPLPTDTDGSAVGSGTGASSESSSVGAVTGVVTAAGSVGGAAWSGAGAAPSSGAGGVPSTPAGTGATRAPGLRDAAGAAGSGGLAGTNPAGYQVPCVN